MTEALAVPSPSSETRGLTAEGLANVRALFDRHLELGYHPGAQLAVFRDGALVLEVAGGEAAPG
jgi:hypothetical protein